jgi:RNA polymerase sigma factor (sigma-70 family)
MNERRNPSGGGGNYVTVQDSDLVAASLAGDHAAFGELADRHAPRLTALAGRLLGDAVEAEDLTQETLLQAFLGLGRLRDPERFSSWIYGIALNLAKMRLRGRRNGALPALDATRLAALVAADPSPAEIVEARELWSLVESALDVLPVEQRRAVLLHYVDGLSCEEIAALLGEPAGTVRVRLHRARARLRVRLSGLAPTRREAPTMIEVTLEDVVIRVLAREAGDEVSSRSLRIVLLREQDGDRVLPIWIGAAEGDALALQLTGGTMPRPLTADLTASLLEASGARIERVAIASLRDKTYYAVIALSAGGRTSEIDARPSDALNLAVRVGAAVYVDEEIMAASGMRADEVRGKLDDDPAFEGEPEGEWRTLSAELLDALHPPWPGTGSGRSRHRLVASAF